VLLVPRVPVLRRLVRTPAGTPPALRAASAPHGPLEARPRLLGNARARGRLSLAAMRRVRGPVKFFAHFSVNPGMFPCVFSAVLFSMSFFVLFQVFFPMSWRRLGGQCFFMHFIGDGLGFRYCFLVIVLVIVSLIRVLIALLITFVIGVQRFLQFFEFGGLDIRFGHGFDRFGALFGVSLRFFVLGLGQLFGERGYVLLGHVSDMRVRDVRRTRFGVKPVEIASDFGFGVRRCGCILRRAGGGFGSQVRRRLFVFCWNRCCGSGK
jgi:hypothetical protein